MGEWGLESSVMIPDFGLDCNNFCQNWFSVAGNATLIRRQRRMGGQSVETALRRWKNCPSLRESLEGSSAAKRTVQRHQELS